MDPEDPDSDLEHFQNLTISSFYLFQAKFKVKHINIHHRDHKTGFCALYVWESKEEFSQILL